MPLFCYLTFLILNVTLSLEPLQGRGFIMTLTNTANHQYQKPPVNENGQAIVTHRYLGSADYQALQAQQQKQSVKP